MWRWKGEEDTMVNKGQGPRCLNESPLSVCLSVSLSLSHTHTHKLIGDGKNVIPTWQIDQRKFVFEINFHLYYGEYPL